MAIFWQWNGNFPEGQVESKIMTTRFTFNIKKMLQTYRQQYVTHCVIHLLIYNILDNFDNMLLHTQFQIVTTLYYSYYVKQEQQCVVCTSMKGYYIHMLVTLYYDCNLFITNKQQQGKQMTCLLDFFIFIDWNIH